MMKDELRPRHSFFSGLTIHHSEFIFAACDSSHTLLVTRLADAQAFLDYIAPVETEKRLQH